MKPQASSLKASTRKSRSAVEGHGHLLSDLSLPLGLVQFQISSGWGGMSPEQSGQRVHMTYSCSMKSSPAVGHPLDVTPSDKVVDNKK